jgi:hypothetical protein
MSGRSNYFYYQTIKNLIASFGIIFSDVVYVNDFGDTIKVPLHYSPREKFIEFIQVKTDYDSALDTDTTLPRMGFELSTIDYDSSRMLNPMSKIRDVADASGNYMYNRVPYMFSFTLYLGTRKFEDSLKIIEQIVPFFTPDFNITIKDKGDFGISTDVPIVLNNVSYTMDWQGSFETRRTILWQLDFSAKAYLYSNIREQKRIKETIIGMEDKDFNLVYESLISTVNPREAEKSDPHTIIDQLIGGKPPIKLSFNAYTGSILSLGSPGNDDPASVIHLRPAYTGADMQIIEGLQHGGVALPLSSVSGETLNSTL